MLASRPCKIARPASMLDASILDACFYVGCLLLCWTRASDVGCSLLCWMLASRPYEIARHASMLDASMLDACVYVGCLLLCWMRASDVGCSLLMPASRPYKITRRASGYLRLPLGTGIPGNMDIDAGLG